MVTCKLYPADLKIFKILVVEKVQINYQDIVHQDCMFSLLTHIISSHLNARNSIHEKSSFTKTV